MEEILKVLEEKKAEIELSKKQIAFIENNFKSPVFDKKIFSDCIDLFYFNQNIIAEYLKLTKPNLKKIKLDCNALTFELYDVKFRLNFNYYNDETRKKLTHNSDLYIYVGWYTAEKDVNKYDTEDLTELYSLNLKQMKKYYIALDNKENYDTLMRLRFRNYENCNKFKIWLLWNLRFKYKDPHRKEWEKEFKKEDIRLLEQFEYMKERLKISNLKLENMNKFAFEELKDLADNSEFIVTQGELKIKDNKLIPLE